MVSKVVQNVVKKTNKFKYIAKSFKYYDTSEKKDELINMIKNIGLKILEIDETNGKFIYITAIKY